MEGLAGLRRGVAGAGGDGEGEGEFVGVSMLAKEEDGGVGMRGGFGVGLDEDVEENWGERREMADDELGVDLLEAREGRGAAAVFEEVVQ